MSLVTGVPKAKGGWVAATTTAGHARAAVDAKVEQGHGLL